MTFEPLADTYSPLDGAFLQGMFQIKTECMAEEELDALLEMSSWTVTEALHVACKRKIIFPSNCFITEEMGNILREMKEAHIKKELRLGPAANVGGEGSGGSLMLANEPAEVVLKIALQRESRSINSARFLEWMINSGHPLPEMINKKIRVEPLVPYTFESYWAKRRDNMWHTPISIVRGVTKHRRRGLQQKTAVQCLLYESPGMSLDKMERHCLKQGYIPGEGYDGVDTFEQNVQSVLPKSIRGRSVGEEKRYNRIELKPLHGIFMESSRICVDLPELKIICQCIGDTLRALHPEIAREAIYLHPLTQEYMSDCHSAVRRMYDNWIGDIFPDLKIAK